MKVHKLWSFSFVFMASLAALFVVSASNASAATMTWDGGGSDNKMSTAENWDGDVTPTAGDDLVFPVDTSKLTVENDFAAATSFNSITFSGVAIEQNDYNFSGNSIDLVAGITDSSTGFNTYVNFYNDFIFNSNQSIEALWFMYFNGSVSGSGSITQNGGFSLFFGPFTLTGAVSVNEGFMGIRAYSTDASFSNLTIAKDASFDFNAFDFSGTSNGTFTFTKPITLGGTLSFSTIGGGGNYKVNLTGDITLTADAIIDSEDIVATYIKGALIGPGFSVLPGGSKVTIINESTNNTSSTPGGSVAPKYTTITVEANDKQPNLSDVVGDLEILVLDGERSNITVAFGGILKGTGKAGSVTVNEGGKIAPGKSPGCLSTGNLTMVSGSTYDFEVGGTTECTEYDQIKVTGTVDLGSGTLNTVILNSFKPKNDQSFKIIDNDASDAVTGTFKDLPEGATFKVGDSVFKITYKGGDGNDVVLSAVVVATPDTGFRLMKSNPAVTLLATIFTASGIVVVARRSSKATSRR